MKNSIDLFDDMMQDAEDIKQRKQMGEQLLKDIPDLYDKLKLREATYSDGVIHVEPVKVDSSPDAEGMDPELFNDILDSIQEIVDIESGKIDESDYDVVEIQANEKPSDVVFSGIPEELSEIIKKQPSETVVLKDDGTVDKQKSPNFYDWMING